MKVLRGFVESFGHSKNGRGGEARQIELVWASGA